MILKAITTKCCLLYDQGKKNTHQIQTFKPQVISEPLGCFQICEIQRAQLHADLYCLHAGIPHIPTVKAKVSKWHLLHVFCVLCYGEEGNCKRK